MRALDQQAKAEQDRIAEAGRPYAEMTAAQKEQAAYRKQQQELLQLQPVKMGTDAIGREIYGTRDPKTGVLHPIDPQTGLPAVPPVPGPTSKATTGTATDASSPGVTPMIGPLPTSAENAAKMIAEYRIPPMSSFAMKTQYGQAVMGRVQELNPDYAAEEYASRNKAVSAFGTGKQGDQVRFFNNTVQHLSTLDGLISAMNTGDVQLLNRVSNAFKNQFGAPAPGNFEAAKAIVGQEIVKAIVANGGGEAERQAAAATLAAAKSPEQLRGIINTYKELAGAQLRDLKVQYENSTGLHNFESKLIPESKAELDKITARAAATNAPAPKEGDRKQFKQGWGVYRNGQWVAE